MSSILFLRQYPFFLGGHLKVFNYLAHAASYPGLQTRLYLTSDSIDPGELLPRSTQCVAHPVRSDAYFIAGANWRFLDEAKIDTRSSCVFNLIQGFRHLDDAIHARYLERYAVRICVSDTLADELRSSGRAHGPIVSIPNGADIGMLEGLRSVPKEPRVFIAGAKNPDLAAAVAAALQARRVPCTVSIALQPREAFLRDMASHAVMVALSDRTDGFYLPALEAMAVGSAVVTLAHRGPASFCRNGVNALVAQESAGDLARLSAELVGDAALRIALIAAAQVTARRHSLEAERAAFFSVLERHMRSEAS